MPFLLEIHTPYVAKYFSSKTAGIWRFKLGGALTAILGSLTMKYEGLPGLTPEDIQYARIGLDPLSRTDTEAENFTTAGSFRYDPNDFAVDFNIADFSSGEPVGWRSPVGRRIIVGIMVGMCDTVDYSRFDKSHYDGVFFDPRLKSLPEIQAKRDNLESGMQAYNDWTITATNDDGAHESSQYEGSYAILRKVPTGGERADGKSIAIGIIKKTTAGNDFSISVGDMRRRLDNDANCGFFSKDTLPYLSDDDAGKKIPIYYNEATGIDLVCMNKTEDLSDSLSSVFRYCFCASVDSLHSPKRVDRIYKVGSEGTVTIAAGFSFGTAYPIGLRREDRVNITLSVLSGETTDLVENTDFTLSQQINGYRKISFIQSATLSSNAVEITVSATSEDNNDKDIEQTISGYTTQLFDSALGVAYISLPASIAYDGGDSPMDLKADIFGFYNHTPGESERLNAADIMKDVLYLFSGYRYTDSCDVQSWEVERAKIVADDMHVFLHIEDDKTVNDCLSSVGKAAKVLITLRPDELFEIRLDSEYANPVCAIKSYERFAVPSGSRDTDRIISHTKITWGAQSGDKSVYTDTSREIEIESEHNTSKKGEYDLDLSDIESAVKFSDYVLDRAGDIHEVRETESFLSEDIESAYINNSVSVPANRAGTITAIYDIESMKKNLQTRKAKLTLRHRYTADYEGDYVQGVMSDDFMCDANMIGDSRYEI